MWTSSLQPQPTSWRPDVDSRRCSTTSGRAATKAARAAAASGEQRGRADRGRRVEARRARRRRRGGPRRPGADRRRSAVRSPLAMTAIGPPAGQLRARRAVAEALRRQPARTVAGAVVAGRGGERRAVRRRQHEAGARAQRQQVGRRQRRRAVLAPAGEDRVGAGGERRRLLVGPAGRDHARAGLDRRAHRAREAQHVDDHDHGDRGAPARAARRVPSRSGRRSRPAPAATSRRCQVGQVTAGHQRSQCRTFASGSRLAGLKSVPIV